jgi:hypothetical protein
VRFLQAVEKTILWKNPESNMDKRLTVGIALWTRHKVNRSKLIAKITLIGQKSIVLRNKSYITETAS